MSVSQSTFHPRAPFLAGLFAFRLLALSLLLACALAIGLPASAQRIDFPATYQITHVSQIGNEVQLTLSLTIHNYSGKDLQNSGIVLYGSPQGSDLIGTFDLVKIFPSYQEITVSHQFTLPKAEYAQWQHGAKPSLQILFPDGTGGTRTDTIDARLDTRPDTRPNTGSQTAQ
jgi:hypothetical protein